MWGRLLAVKALHTASYSPRLRTAKGRRRGDPIWKSRLTNTTKSLKKKIKKANDHKALRNPTDGLPIRASRAVRGAPERE